MKVTWKWTEDDMTSFPGLERDTEEFDILLKPFDTEEDVFWRISTEIYLLRGIVETCLDSVKLHVKNWDLISFKNGRRVS